MVATHRKFQNMLPSKYNPFKIKIGVFKLESTKSVKLLGLAINHSLTTDTHISNISKKASTNNKSLSRLRNTLEDISQNYCLALLFCHSLKPFKNKLVGNSQEITCLCTMNDFRTGYN